MIRYHRRLGTRQGGRLYAIVVLAIATATAGCRSGAPTTGSPVPPTTAAAAAASSSGSPTEAAAPTAPPHAERQPVAGGPVLLGDDITLRKVVDTGAGSIRLARDPVDGEVYVLNPASGLSRVKLAAPAETSNVATLAAILADGGMPSGMAFGPDGTLFVVANRKVGTNQTQALIRKGVAAAGGRFTWTTLASTAPYPLSDTPFDHLFNGIAVSPDGAFVYVNSGSRTDHGEVEDNHGAFPDTREVPLTSAIFRLPAAAHDLTLPADAAALKPYLFADGTRNAYDPAFAPNGELFSGDNGPDADYPDELNWLREGQHYGFPWRFGDQDNPQQFAGYDGSKDVRLSQDFTAVKSGTYRDDPGFPKPPGAFADPLANLGPDAAQYRGEDGRQHDAAAEGKPLRSFTPHRSPLGLVFVADPRMPPDLRGDGDTLSAFVLSWGAVGGTLSDHGQDLLHLKLTKRGDDYEIVTTQIAREFKNPIDAVVIENRLYVLEYGADSAIWELTFE